VKSSINLSFFPEELWKEEDWEGRRKKKKKNMFWFLFWEGKSGNFEQSCCWTDRGSERV